MSRPGSHHKGGSMRGTPPPNEESEEMPPREPTPVPACSIYMHAIEWLLDVKAIPVSLMCNKIWINQLKLTYLAMQARRC